MGISVLRVGRHMICKTFSYVTKVMQEIIYLAALCFDDISIVKPISSRPANSELYLVLLGKRDSADDILDLMERVIKHSDDIPNSILSEELPEDFIKYIDSVNEESMDMQQTMGKWIMEQKKDIPVYDLNKALYLWSLPEFNDGNDLFYRLKRDNKARH